MLTKDGRGPALRPVIRGLICGGITTAAICAVMGRLDDYQVLHNYNDSDQIIGIVGGVFAGLVAAVLILVGHQRSTGHALVPVLLVPGVLVPLTNGLERDWLEAAVLWSTVAVAVHLVGATRPRRTAVPLVMIVVLAGAGGTWAAQEHWRAHEFDALDGRLYVPELPGFRVTDAHPGSYSVTVRLESADGRAGVEGVVEWAWPSCPAPESPAVVEQEPRPRICLPGGHVMTLFLDPGTTLPLPPADIRVRRVDGAELAGYPDGVHFTEAD